MDCISNIVVFFFMDFKSRSQRYENCAKTFIFASNFNIIQKTKRRIMKRHLFLSLLLALFASSTLGANQVKIEPAFWWSGMKNHELQLMVYGKDIAGYLPSINYPGVQLKSSVALESPNYLLIYLNVANAQPGTFDITFTVPPAPTVTSTSDSSAGFGRRWMMP